MPRLADIRPPPKDRRHSLKLNHSGHLYRRAVARMHQCPEYARFKRRVTRLALECTDAAIQQKAKDWLRMISDINAHIKELTDEMKN